MTEITIEVREQYAAMLDALREKHGTEQVDADLRNVVEGAIHESY